MSQLYQTYLKQQIRFNSFQEQNFFKESFSLLNVQSIQQPYFCYLDVRNSIQQISVLCMIGLSLLVSIYIGIKFYSLRHAQLNNIVKGTYILLLLWSIFYVLKDLFAIALYQVEKDKQPNLQFQQFLSQMSRVYFMIDWTTVFILQHILIMIPYNWIGKIVDIFKQFQGSQNQYIGIQHKIKFWFTLYLKLRFLIIPLIIVFIVLDDQRVVTYISLILLSFLLLEAGLIIFMLIIGLKITKSNQRLQQILDKGQISKITTQYLVLLLTTFVRFSMNFWYVIISGIIQSNFFLKQCTLDQKNQLEVSTTIKAMIQIIGGSILTHFIPVLIVLRIYTVKNTQDQITNSLLLIPQNNSSSSNN